MPVICAVLGKCQKAEGSETVGGGNTCGNGKSPGKCTTGAGREGAGDPEIKRRYWSEREQSQEL